MPGALATRVKVRPMKKSLLLVAAAIAVGISVQPTEASDRYATRPPVVVSPDLSAPWVMQLSRKPGRLVGTRQALAGYQMQPLLRVRRQPRPDVMQTAAIPQMYTKREMQRQLDPKFLPQQVSYDGSEKAGTIIIDSSQKFLYLVMGKGQARHYNININKKKFN